MGNMHGGAEIAVEGLQLGELKWVVQRREIGMRMSLRDVRQDGWSLGDDTAICNQCRYTTFGIDRKVCRLALFTGSKIQTSGFVIRARGFQRNV